MPEVQTPFRSRLAPTPSGFLHEGNAFNFVLTWLLARKNGGVLRLRIDDYDLPRVRDEYLTDIFRLLHWLGLDWDEGPQTLDEHKQRFGSAQRMDLYRSLLSGLQKTGQTHACACSKKDLAKRACACRQLNLNEKNAAIKLYVPKETHVGFWDVFMGEMRLKTHDFTIWRKNGLPAYQLASVADDAHFGTNFIVRGNDLLDSTAAQIYLAKTASLNAFQNVRFAHHPLLADFEGKKLSKSAGSVAMKNYYQNRQAKEEFYRRFCRWARLGEEAISIQNLSELLKDEKVILAISQ